MLFSLLFFAYDILYSIVFLGAVEPELPFECTNGIYSDIVISH